MWIELFYVAICVSGAKKENRKKKNIVTVSVLK